MKGVRTWVLIADGARARVVINDGPGKGVQQVFEDEFLGVNAPGRDLASDRPGRTFDSGGQGRHAMEPSSNPKDVEKHHFVEGLGKVLTDGLNKGSFDRLVLVAPPKVLGDLRATLSKNVQAKVTGELNKDLTHISLNDLPEHLGAVLAV